jgi:hypothetical protein
MSEFMEKYFPSSPKPTNRVYRSMRLPFSEVTAPALPSAMDSFGLGETGRFSTPDNKFGSHLSLISGQHADAGLSEFGKSLGSGLGGSSMPGKQGGWLQYGDLALGVAQVGLDIWGGLEQSKMNKFMRGYYGDQMDMQRTDFANSAKSTNEALAGREARRLSAMGMGYVGTPENDQKVAEYMQKWGVQENF